MTGLLVAAAFLAGVALGAWAMRTWQRDLDAWASLYEP